MARRRAPKRTKTHIELEGMDDVRKALATLNVAALREVKEANRISAEEMRDEAKSRVPVSEPGTKGEHQPSPGTTRDSITAQERDFGLTYSIGSGYFNARFIEQGTSKQAARPFLNPAFQLVKPKWLERVRQALGIAAKEAA